MKNSLTLDNYTANYNEKTSRWGISHFSRPTAIIAKADGDGLFIDFIGTPILRSCDLINISNLMDAINVQHKLKQADPI